MTSRYVAKWKYVIEDGVRKKIIRMRLVLRGFMDWEAFSIDTFSGTAKRQSQRMLASEAACHSDWILASMGVDKAFLNGFTYAETGGSDREAQVFYGRAMDSSTLTNPNIVFSVLNLEQVQKTHQEPSH